MRPRWRKVLRDLASYRTRTVLVVLSIAIGVTAVGMIVESRLVLGRQLSQEFAAAEPAHAELLLASFDESFAEAAAKTPGVAAAQAQRAIVVQVQVGPDEWVDLDLITIPDFEQQATDIVWPQAGAWPAPEDSVLVERSTIHLLGGAGIGDTLAIRTADHKARYLALAGTVYAPTFPAGYLRGHPYGFITPETQERLGYGRDYDRLLLRMDGSSPSAGVDDPAYVRQVAKEVADRAENAGLVVRHTRVNVPLEYPAKDTINTLFLILVLLGALTLVVSVFLVINTVSAVVGTQTRQIGVMKTLGARERDLRRMYRGLVAIYGMGAALLAVPLAAAGSLGLTAYAAGLLNLDVRAVFPPLVVVAAEVVIALGVPVLAAMPPVERGVRITIREALAAAGVVAGFGTGVLDRVVAGLRVLPCVARFALRNAFRRRRRLVITLAALALGGAVFMSVLSLQASLHATLDRAIAFYGFDAQAVLRQPTRAEVLAAEAVRVSGVVGAEPWLGVQAQRVRSEGGDSAPYQVVGIPAGGTTLQPSLAAGRWLVPEDENALVVTDNVLEDEPDLKVGSRLELTVNGRTETWTLVGVIEAPTPEQAMYANLEPLAKAAGVPGRANVVVARTAAHDRATQEAAAKEIREALEARGLEVASTLTIGYIREQQTMRFDVLVTFLAVMAALIGAVGGVGLSGTMTLNVAERTREIGVLRAVGASNRALRLVFLLEGWFMGVMAWLAGVVVAVPISVFLSRRIGFAFINRPLEFAFSGRGVLLWLVVVVVVSTLATLAPAFGASRMTVRETLAYE